MKNYLIVTDTTSAMNGDQAKKYGIELVSLSVLIDHQEYKDQIDISTEELYQKLRDGCIPTTSQPNTGYLQNLMEKWKSENYEAIIVITCSSDLSGTWSGFNLVKNDLGIEEDDLLDAIMFHTTGNKKMSIISKILFAADKIDPLRNYDSSHMIKMMKENYESGFIEVVKETKKFLKFKNNDTNYLSEKMYDFYL